jgi:magnesium transporter
MTPPEVVRAESIDATDLLGLWPILDAEERVSAFRLLNRDEAYRFLRALSTRDEAQLLLSLPASELDNSVRLLAPDDAADVIQEAPEELRPALMAAMDENSRREVKALLVYKEDAAGGLMNPRYGRLRPEMTVDEAVAYLRKQSRERVETIYSNYVVDDAQHLIGVVSFRDLFIAPRDTKVRDIMRTEVVSVRDDLDQEAVSRVFAQHKYVALPVVDAENRIHGVVTFDDIGDVVREEATEDLHKFGGTESLDAPYMESGMLPMLRKRAGWLAALFVGELLTATAMTFFEDQIARAVVLALFVPLIISSGGNSGSQASTLVIRAMALGEVKLRDWFRVMCREIVAGLALGLMLGSIGFFRIVVWQAVRPIYGEHYLLIASTVFGSLIGVVMFGTLAGSLLPFLLRALRFDPASASAPFVATLVDVTGLVIYFSMASLMLSGTLL